jgi:hypothetical protein
MTTLLTRDHFRERVFARDKQTCVVCAAPAVDAHHIIERKLWDDGGYYLDNGVSLCASCHVKAESTEVSCEELRLHAGIKSVLLPPSLDADSRYDKWGNAYVDGRRRFKGPLYATEAHARIVRGHDDPDVFVSWVKYPRTPHLPWSPGATSDDKRLTVPQATELLSRTIISTLKLDGENTTLYRDHVHARSVDSDRATPDRAWIKSLWASICHDIPPNMRICGENLYAKHSIGYSELPSFFLVFSIWIDNECLSWADTVEWASLLGLHTVPVLSKSVAAAVSMQESIHKLLLRGLENVPIKADEGEHEGYVVRPAGSFTRDQFGSRVAKYVRANHVQTNDHWRHQTIVPNKLRKSER